MLLNMKLIINPTEKNLGLIKLGEVSLNGLVIFICNNEIFINCATEAYSLPDNRKTKLLGLRRSRKTSASS